MEVEGKIPLVGSAKTKIEEKAEWGITMNWGSSTSNEIEVAAKLSVK